MGERTERIHGKRIGGSVHSASASVRDGGRERSTQGKEQSGSTPAHTPACTPTRTVPGSQSRLSAVDGALWVVTLGPSRILTVPGVPSPSWPLSRLLLPEPWTDPPFHLCPLPSALCSLGSTPLSSWPHGALHPLSSPRNHLLLGGAGPTLTYLGITSWRAGRPRGRGGCGGPSSALSPPPPPGSAPASGCGAGKRWH